MDYVHLMIWAALVAGYALWSYALYRWEVAQMRAAEADQRAKEQTPDDPV